MEKLARNSLVPSDVLREDIVDLLDFIERLKNEEDQTVLDTDQIEKLTFLSACLQLCHYILDGSNARMSFLSYEVHDMVQSLFHQCGDDMLVKLKDHIIPRLRENINSFIISDHHSESSATITEDQLVELLDALFVNIHYLPKVCAELILPSMTQYELLQKVFGNLIDFHRLKVNGYVEHKTIEYILPQFQLMAERVGHFCLVLLSYELDNKDEEDENEDSSQINSMLVKPTFEYNSSFTGASPDILGEYLIHLQHHMVNAITPGTSARNIHIMIEFLLIILSDVPKDFIHYEKLFVLLARVGALIREVSILVRNLAENAKETNGASLNLLENIELLRKDLKNVFLKAPSDSSQLRFPMSDGLLFMTLLLRNLNDLLNSNAYSVVLIKEEIGRVKEHLEHIRSFFGNVEQELYHGLLQLIFLLPDTVEKIKLVKEEVQEKITKKTSITFANSPNKPVESKSSIAGKIIVSFEEETEWIIRKLTSGPSEVDVIFIVGMPGLGKTTLAYKVYTDKSVVDHFDIHAWCTVDQERNEKKLLQKIFNQVIGLEERFNEDNIDDDVADKLRRQFFGRRVFGEEHCPDELKDVGEKIARKCDGLPLVLDLISGVIARKKKKKASWLEVLNNLESFILKDEEEVMKVIQLSYGHLSDHLKPCFLYLASYPKDKDITISELKDLWSDEGLVEPTDLKSVEEVMEVYVDELISSSLVIVRGGRERRCQIHDLVHDFCSIKTRKEKLFDLTSSTVPSSSSSSSDPMLRGMTIHYDEDLHMNEFPFQSRKEKSLCETPPLFEDTLEI
ncbi:putative phospholipase A(1) DAD1, chloroplastic-like [Capsicum annuum]|uniref:Uncharacterized protein n=1 Tax=Capsicum annuum TaxID=4072 RepID=A0A2G2ZGC5_CAPAN|nr:putative phospholipase A(1) DAD1, chloroplastic-like [Capsicum annuum]PHT80974.1 hypothetical protein T459_13989 [Capsicum annuum]